MQETKISTTTKMALVLSQHRLAIALKFSVITLAVVALYFQDLSMVFTGALTDESTYHILAIPFLFAYLIYRKRKMINAALQPPQTIARGFQKYFSTLAGISLCAVAILAYWYGSYTFTPLEYHMFTLPFLVAGLTLILFNTPNTKTTTFPHSIPHLSHTTARRNPLRPRLSTRKPKCISIKHSCKYIRTACNALCKQCRSSNNAHQTRPHNLAL